MLTTRLQTICASVATTRCHQMRVAGRAGGRRDARSDVQKAQTEAGGGVLGLMSRGARTRAGGVGAVQ